MSREKVFTICGDFMDEGVEKAIKDAGFQIKSYQLFIHNNQHVEYLSGMIFAILRFRT
jgi:hypothetical protein